MHVYIALNWSMLFAYTIFFLIAITIMMIITFTLYHQPCSLLGFPGGPGGKESTCSKGGLGSIPGLGRSPRGGHGNPLQYSYLENPHGQRKLVGPRPWGHTESDTTKHKPVSHREN